ncbi:MAG TPA: hypothetical protein VIX37_11780 [Candidatus Sulfotelmatobacter sp.]
MIPSTLILRSPNPSGLQLWCVVGFCAGIGFFIYGFRLLQRRRLILDTPFSKIRSAAMGMIEVSGLAVGPYTMVAPITGRNCYYYRTLIWEWKASGRDKTWVKIAGECMHLPFFIDDNTGRLLVDPRGADLDLHGDFEQEFSDSFFSTNDPVPDTVRSFLARHGIVTNNKIKVEEFCIKPKNSLFILGTLSDNPGVEVIPQPIRDEVSATFISSPGFSLSLNSISFSSRSHDAGFKIGSLAQRLGVQPSVRVVRLSADTGPTNTTDRSQQQKIAAALMQAGISNPQAWSAAGVPTASNGPGIMVLTAPFDPASANGSPSNVSSSDQVNGFDPHPPVVLRKGTNNKTFLISWRSQQELARSLGWKCTLMIWGGPALALLSLYSFLGIRNLF